MDKHAVILIFFIFFGYRSTSAQSKLFRNALPEANVQWGTIVAHSKKITIQTGHPVFGAEVGLRWQTSGRKSWHAQRNFPSYGISGAWYLLGEGAHGHTLGIVPYLQFDLSRKHRLRINMRVGAGLSYVTHPYHIVDNPHQNAIGAYLNNMTQVRWQLLYPITKDWQIFSALCLTHISNGSIKLPNYGVNIPSLAFGITQLRESDPAVLAESTTNAPRWGGLLYVGYSRYNYHLVGGPSYPVSVAAAAATYRFSPNNRFSLGGEYEFNRAIYEWGKKSTTFKTEEEATRGATRLAVTAGNEFRFGKIGIHLHFGYYVGKGFNQNLRDPFYNKYTIRYHLPALFSSRIRPHLACSLKAHKSVAEHFGVQVGFAW